MVTVDPLSKCSNFLLRYSSRSQRAPPSDPDGFAGDPEGCLGGEEDGHGSDVFGFS